MPTNESLKNISCILDNAVNLFKSPELVYPLPAKYLVLDSTSKISSRLSGETVIRILIPIMLPNIKQIINPNVFNDGFIIRKQTPTIIIISM